MSTAAGWEKWADWNERQHRDVIAWLCGPLEPRMTVLDIASGVGQPALAAARRVAPGRVIATDVAADMLAALERRAPAAGISNIEIHELDMHDLRGIADDSVDAVTFAFALMFSPEPVKAVREAWRVVRPGGVMRLTVWDEPDRNPFFTTMLGSLTQVLRTPAPAPNQPGPFALSAPGALEAVLASAGWRDITIEARPFQFELESLDDHWAMASAVASPLKRAVESRPDAVPALRAAIAQALAPFMDGTRVRVTATPLCASARK